MRNLMKYEFFITVFFIQSVVLTTFQMWMNVSSPRVQTEGPVRTPLGRTCVTVPPAGSENTAMSVRIGILLRILCQFKQCNR